MAKSVKPQVEEYCKDHNIVVTTIFVRDPILDVGEDVEFAKYFEWRYVLRKGDKIVHQGPYYCGMARVALPPRLRKAVSSPYPGRTVHDREQWLKWGQPTPPTAADILYSLFSDAAGADQSFKSWARDLGYSTDSIKAFKTYQACQDIADALRCGFTQDEYTTLEELLRDY